MFCQKISTLKVGKAGITYNIKGHFFFVHLVWELTMSSLVVRVQLRKYWACSVWFVFLVKAQGDITTNICYSEISDVSALCSVFDSILSLNVCFKSPLQWFFSVRFFFHFSTYTQLSLVYRSNYYSIFSYLSVFLECSTNWYTS